MPYKRKTKVIQDPFKELTDLSREDNYYDILNNKDGIVSVHRYEKNRLKPDKTPNVKYDALNNRMTSLARSGARYELANEISGIAANQRYLENKVTGDVLHPSSEENPSYPEEREEEAALKRSTVNQLKD
jgi:hypothetical protein